MISEKIIVGAILIVIGIVFSLNNKNISKGASKFYQKLYTEKNLSVMFRAVGLLLIVGGMVLMVVN